MSELDPWALPEGGAVGHAGIPGQPYRPQITLSQPLNRAAPIMVIVLASLYALAGIAEIIALNNRASLAQRFIGGGTITPDQAQSADDWVTNVSHFSLMIFIGTLVAIGFWRRSLNQTLGSIGAQRAVFRRAGYIYFRAAWIAAIILALILNGSMNATDLQTAEQVVSHDHSFMLYYGLRSLVGIMLIVFALRLKRLSEEAVDRIIATLTR